MAIKDQSYQETYTQAKRIAPHINELLREETPATRTAIELEARALLRTYEPRRTFFNNVFETAGGVLILGSPMLILALGDLERYGLREHANLLALGGLGIMAGCAISVLDNRYLSKLYRAFAYLSRGTSTTEVQE